MDNFGIVKDNVNVFVTNDQEKKLHSRDAHVINTLNLLQNCEKAGFI